MPKRSEQIPIAIDQLVNTIFGGWADETISCRAYRMQGKSGKFAKLRKLIDALFCEVNPIPVKTALNLMGKEVGPLRAPLCTMEAANEEKLRKALVNSGIAVK